MREWVCDSRYLIELSIFLFFVLKFVEQISQLTRTKDSVECRFITQKPMSESSDSMVFNVSALSGF